MSPFCIKLITVLFCINVVTGCGSLDGKDLREVLDDPRYHASEGLYVDPPVQFVLFTFLETFLYEPECKGNIQTIELNGPRNLLFFYTAEDICDGGNAYGVIFENGFLKYVIRDSEIEKVQYQ